MEENKKSNGLADQLYVIFILIGVVALVASYFLVFSPKNEEITTVEDEISTLKPQYEELNRKYNNITKIKAAIEDNKIKIENVYDEYNGDVTYQSVIADIYDMEQTITNHVNSLSFSVPEVAYSFSNGNEGKLLGYDMTVVCTYDEMKRTLKYFDEQKAKRKVPTSVSFAYNDVDQYVTLSLRVNEFAIKGVDTEGEEIAVAPVVYPSAPVGRTNIFYSDVLK